MKPTRLMQPMAQTLLLGLVLGLGGCMSLAPDYARGPLPVAETWPQGWPEAPSGTSGEAAPPAQAGVAALPWQRFVQDERLRTLIAQALTHNRDLQAAAHNLEAARALYRQGRAGLFPTLGVAGTDTREWQGDDRQDSVGITRSSQLSLATTYELDLVGRIRNQSQAALERYLASAEGARALRITLIGDVAQAYLTYASDKALGALASSTQDTARRGMELSDARFRAGMGTRQDYLVQEAIFQQARADEIRYARLMAQDRNALELLVGQALAPEQLPDALVDGGYTRAELPPGLPAQVLLARPDVRQAEHQLKATHADIGVARAAFFPTLSLTGEAGGISTTLLGLVQNPTHLAGLTATLGLPIFSGGANEAKLAQARALREAALASYEKSIQKAFREVADALVAQDTLAAEKQAQGDYLSSLEQQLRIVEARQRLGRDGALAVFVIQRQVLAARAALIRARLAEASNHVALYKTLGGGGTE
jgi:outer membrane protein, multidrug efflux system